MFHVLYLSILNLEQWIQFVVVHSVNFFDQITLSLVIIIEKTNYHKNSTIVFFIFQQVNQVPVITGPKVIIQKVLN